jgi:anti-sigma regulatory factor (Ser/Thr protein kinase)
MGASELSITIEPVTAQVPVARRFVLRAIDRLGGPELHPFVDDVALATSEAVTNAVCHAGTEITITVERLVVGYRVSVHDDEPTMIPSPRAAHGPEDGTGRGLAIIEAVADSWGIDQVDDDGKTLWFELEPGRDG